MSQADTLDFDALLKPISDEFPSGASLREHPELSRAYYAVREARNMAMEAEKALARLAMLEQRDIDRELGGGDEARPVPNWGKVADMASDLLYQNSKDLWVVSWLIEANTRLAGVAGFRDGIKLARLMSEQFWDTLYPRPDEDEGYGHTVAQLSGLDNTLAPALEAASMLPENDGVTWTNYRVALDLDQLAPEERAAKIEEGAMSLDRFQHALREAGREALLETQTDLEQAISELKNYAEAMQGLCGKDDSGYPLAPSSSNLERTLDRMLQVFHAVTEGLLDSPALSEESDQQVVGELTAAGGNHQSTGNLLQRPVASREEALQHLLRVADYFRKAEPHSPVSYALEQAVRWGRMPLPELLKDLVSDDHVLGEVFKRMGIARSEEHSE